MGTDNTVVAPAAVRGGHGGGHVAEGEGRVFLRGITSEHYGLAEFRRRQRTAPRVRKAGTVVDDAKVAHSGDSEQSRTWWVLGPGDDPFLTQTVQVHFVELQPGGANHGHGHQNEAPRATARPRSGRRCGPPGSPSARRS